MRDPRRGPVGRACQLLFPRAEEGKAVAQAGIRTWNSGMAASGALVLPRDARVGAKAMADSMTLTRRRARPAAARLIKAKDLAEANN